MSSAAAIRNLKATVKREVKLRREFMSKFSDALKEIECLRSVLSEWECDKTCYTEALEKQTQLKIAVDKATGIISAERARSAKLVEALNKVLMATHGLNGEDEIAKQALAEYESQESSEIKKIREINDKFESGGFDSPTESTPCVLHWPHYVKNCIECREFWATASTTESKGE